MIEGYDLDLLDEFLKKPLPDVPEEVWTFLDIAGFPHYENVISNIYAYYLDQENKHGFGRLFLDALINTIKEKVKSLGKANSLETKISYLNEWNQWEVSREEPIEQKRIDILLTETSGDYPISIILENKIFAPINNPLDTYLKVSGKNKKVGVILSLFREEVVHKGFINITHSEFFEELKKLQGYYLESSDQRDLVILKDLIINLKNQTMSEFKQPDLVKFYGEHSSQINNVLELSNNVKSAFLKEVDKIGAQLDFKIKFKNSKKYRELRVKGCDDLGLYFSFNEDNEYEHFSIYLYVYDDLKQNADSLISNTSSKSWLELKKISTSKSIDLCEDDFGTNWTGIAEKNYDLSSIDYNFSKLKDIYKNDWEEIVQNVVSLIGN